ncbi:EF-hand domain-containing protein [Mesorhizobium sp. WSM2239]|uniref:EF-hand domain-containing protein n=2 Tax=unclassified Mesorhizobium TaxID=325217 RepID=A0AAU8DCR0_9HYPH
MHKTILATAATLLVGSSQAFAQQAQPMHEGHLNQIDTNDDGGVSRAEYQTFMTTSFARLDGNRDGVLVESEVADVLTPEQLSSLDSNRDGRVSRNEFMNQVMRDFASADRRRDGYLK